MKRPLSVRPFSSCSLLAGAVFAQEPYKLPPKNVLDILDAPPTPRVSLNRDRDMMLLTESESMPSIAYLSMPMLRSPASASRPATTAARS